MATRVLRPIRIEGNIAYVPLTKGLEAVVDASDIDLVAGYNWFAQVWKHGAYAMRRKWENGRGRPIMMHRAVLGVSGPELVDHINGNGLDNRRANLRMATPAQNNANAKLKPANKSGTKCVHWAASRRKWRVQIMRGDKRVHVGYFSCLDAASAAAEQSIVEVYGEFGRPR